jgi:hypothetical protein
MKISTGVEGNGVTQGVAYTKDAAGNIVAPSEQNATLNNLNSNQNTKTEEVVETKTQEQSVPTREKTALEQFLPSFDSDKFEPVWNNGKVSFVAKTDLDFLDEEVVADPQNIGEFPATHSDIPGGTQTQSTDRVAQLEAQLAQQGQIIQLLAKQQLQGVKTPEPVASEPDYSNIDFQDPEQLQAYINSKIDDGIKKGLAPHQETIVNAKTQQEFNAITAKYGKSPNHEAVMEAALTMVKNNPGMSFSLAYEASNEMAILLDKSRNKATASAQPNQAQPQQTITKQDFEAKKTQAKTLPSNSGVRGNQVPAMPDDIKTLGQMLAWNLAHNAGNQ